MAVDYDFTILQPGPSNSSTMGTFWLYKKLDFFKNPLATDDSAKIFKCANKWVLMDSYYRVPDATTAANTWDIGHVDATGAFASTDQSILVAGTSGTKDWTQMIVDRDANQIMLTVDSWIFVSNNTAACASGILEVMIEVMAGPEDNEAVGNSFGR
jgi:hypothetical protein